MKKYFVFVLVVLVLSLAVTACGSGAPTTSLRVDMTDFMYNPADVVVPAGETITLELVNNGAVVHNFIIMNFGTQVGEDFGVEDEANMYWKAELGPGESETFSFVTPSDPGEYQIVCGVEGHYMAGMVGSLTVVSE